MKKIKEYLINFVNGFCMALADSVPGVSGGTVAFVLGFYDRFIISLDDLFHGEKSKKIEALKYLFKVAIGWIFGFLIAVMFLSRLFEKHIYSLSSLFLGFILFSLPLIIREERENLKIKYNSIFFLLIGMAIVIIITYLNRIGGIHIDLDNINIGTFIYVFLVAALAISAMVLPGISGSTILLIFGMYIPIISKIKDFLSFDLSVLPILIVFGLGMIFGILYFTKLLRRCLEKRRNLTIYTIIGMMLGSFYAIAMGPTTLEKPLNMLSFSTFNIWYFFLGGIIVLFLEFLKKIVTKN